MNEVLKETLWFYTGADYHIVNSILWGNKNDFDEGVKIVYDNNIDVIKDAEEMTPEVRFGMSKEAGQRLLDAYQSRTPQEINNVTKAEMAEVAVNDIHIICDAMRPAERELILFRNVDVKYTIENPTVGETVILKGLTSTSTTGQEIDYGDGFRTEYVQYIINVPTGIPVFAVENDYREENEVILPPMKYKITDVRYENGQRIIELEALKTLDIDTLIESGKSALCLK